LRRVISKTMVTKCKSGAHGIRIGVSSGGSVGEKGASRKKENGWKNRKGAKEDEEGLKKGGAESGPKLKQTAQEVGL